MSLSDGSKTFLAGLGVGVVGMCSLSRFGKKKGSQFVKRAQELGSLQAPIAAQRDHEVVFGAVKGENRGDNPIPEDRAIKRNDPWFWLRDDDRKNPEILEHLNNENAYTEQQTSHLKPFMDDLYKEHISHLKETDENPPYINGEWFYYTRTVKGLSYKIHCRKPKLSSAERLPSPESKEIVVLDENKVAEGKKQCSICGVRPSPDHKVIAFSADFKGNETYQVQFMNVAGAGGENTAPEISDTLEGAAGGVSWGVDNKTVFYLTEDETKRPYKLWRHTIGTPQADDVLLFTEDDEQFWLGVGKSKSGEFLFAHSGSSETSEVHVLDLRKPDATLTVIQARTFGLRYDVEHFQDESFIIITNKDDAINNRIMKASLSALSAENWVEMMPYDDTRKIDDIEVFKNYIALEGRQGGLTQLWTVNKKNGGELDASSLKMLEFSEDLYEVCLSTNKVYDTPYLRLCYSSLTTPNTWYDYDVIQSTGSYVTIKEEEVLNFDSANYVCKRVFAKAADGTEIPMSMVYHKDLYADDAKNEDSTQPPAPKPLMLYGYGSYGICIDPGFDRRILPYLDRKMIYCIANIRGGGEMGRYWYEKEGKYLNKRNTFSDFIACAEHIVEKGYSKPEIMACEGRSAGGLLMGNIVNMRPDLFQVAVAGVPFVDLCNTMCDPSIPLTTGEWEEWGNPNEHKFFDYMLSYSPYDNVRSQNYCNILITAGLYDPRVAYWEPTKWVSKLRTLKTDTNEILMKMDLDSGHFSASDRYKYLKEKAFEQAIVLNYLGLAPKKTEATGESRL